MYLQNKLSLNVSNFKPVYTPKHVSLCVLQDPLPSWCTSLLEEGVGTLISWLCANILINAENTQMVTTYKANLLINVENTQMVTTKDFKNYHFVYVFNIHVHSKVSAL